MKLAHFTSMRNRATIACIHYRVNNEIASPELRVIDADGSALGVISREEAFRIAQSKGLDIVEIAPTAKPPVARIISYDKFRYQQEKEERKQRHQQRAKELKQVRITPRAAANDLSIKARKAEAFLEEGHKVEVGIYLRGREKGNRDWALQKLRDFLNMIRVPHAMTMEPRPGGRGFVTQIIKR